MNDSTKFPNMFDASVWSSRATAWFGAFKVPDLTEWFQAALSFAYVRGSEETLEKQKLAARPNSVSPLDSFDSRDWAKEFMSRFRGLTGSFIDEELMAGWFANALMRGYDEHRWKLERESPAGPPSDLEGLETTMRLHHEWAAKNISNLRETLQIRTLGLDAPALKRRLDSAEKQVDWLTERLPELEHSIANPDLKLSRRIDELDERMKAAHDAHVDQTVKWADELDKRLSDLEARVMGNSAELPMRGRRIEELESVVRSGVGGYMYDPRIDEFLKRLAALEQRYATADEARKP